MGFYLPTLQGYTIDGQILVEYLALQCLSVSELHRDISLKRNKKNQNKTKQSFNPCFPCDLCGLRL